MNRIEQIGLAAICLAGAGLRYRGLFANRFHADEALFAGWARLIAVWRDPLLITQPVDKPPLLFYLQALFYPLLGPEEMAARLPSLIVSILLIPLTAQLALRLTGDLTAAMISALLVALTPLTIQFSPTAFSDPLLTFCLTAALYMVSCRRDSRCLVAILTGIFFGLALATKYQALLFVPLVIGLASLARWRREDYIRGLVGLAAIVAGLFLWQAARPTSIGLVSLQWSNIGGLRLIHSWELLPRLSTAAQLWGLSTGWPFICLGGLAAGGLLMSRRLGVRVLPADAAIALFFLGYMLLHWLWSVPVWERYFLPIMPLVAILLGRGISLLRAALHERTAGKTSFAIIILVLVFAQVAVGREAREGRYPIGGNPAADGGAAGVAQLLEDAPYGTVLYDHWYSWHWRYHLFDRKVYVSWFPHADALLSDLRVFAGSGPDRYIALPASDEARPITRRLVENGYRLEPVDGQDGMASMTLYRIIVEEEG